MMRLRMPLLVVIGLATGLLQQVAIMSAAVAIELPPRPANDDIADVPPVTTAAIAAAREDPTLERAYHLLGADPPDWATAFDLFKDRALTGNPIAETAVCVLEWQKGVSSDAWGQSLVWCRAAAERGYAPGQLLMALLLRDSQDASSKGEYLHWLHLAAAQGDAMAVFLIGKAYALGENAPREVALGQSLLRAVIALKTSTSLLVQSSEYRHGIGQAVDVNLANHYLLQAAAAGEWVAQSDLANFYRKGDGHLPKDPALSARWHDKMLKSLLDMVVNWKPTMAQ